MKILYLAPDWGLNLNMTGGAGTHMRGTVAGFLSHGHDVLPLIGGDIVFKKQGSLSSESSATHKNLVRNYVKKIIPTIIRLLMRDIRYYYRGRKLERIILKKIRAFKPDFIYERSAYMNTLGLCLSKKLNVPLFFESDGHIVDTYAQLYGVFSKKFAEYIEKKKLSGADKIVVMSENAITSIAKKYQEPISKFSVKKLGVDESAFVSDILYTDQLCTRFGLKEHFVVGFVAGQLQEYHGMSLLLNVAKQLQEIRTDIIFFVVAGGNLAQVYEREANKKKLSNIIFHPLVPKDMVANYLSIFDLGITPDTIPHMYPIKIPEYGIVGLCPLAPNYPVFKKLFRFEGADHLLFDVGSETSLANKLCWLADNRVFVKEMGQKWKQQVQREFTWSTTVMPVLKAMGKCV
ncbi:MAG: glycosyltransferase [Candidatus Roizmanbacteria bacterium]|nr:glycosyltransferase [Candidatus Roizmanbacteria bacterium]